MRKHLILFTALIMAVLAVFAAAPSLRAQAQEEEPKGIETANKYFEDRLYSKAVEAYKPFLQSKDKDLKYEAELKTAIAYNYQNKYDTALRQIYSYKVPASNLWKARYYLVKLALIKNNIYEAPENQETVTDPTKFTLAQKNAEKKEILSKLWDMRKKLADMSYDLSKDYILNPHSYYSYEDIPPAAMYPTLFDYMVKVWEQYATKPTEEIYEEAYKIKGKDRSTAAELWHLERVEMIPIDTSDFITLKANWMQYISGMTKTYTDAYGVKKYIFQAKETLPKARAAYLAAQAFNNLEMYEDAVKTLDYCTGLELNIITDACKNLKKEITGPRLDFGENKTNAAPNQEYPLQVYTRNLEKFYIHIFKVNPDNIKKLIRGKKNVSIRQNVLNELSLNKPLRTLGISVSYDKKYATHTSDIMLPKESAGFYAIALSQQKEYSYDKSGKKANVEDFIFVNYTDLALASTSYAKAKNITAQTSLGNFYNIYALDAKTGLPKQGVKLEPNTGKTVYTGKDGVKAFAQNKNLKGYNPLSIFASKSGNYAILDGLWFEKPQVQKNYLALNTSMSIYKAGDTIKAQVTAAELKGAAGYLLAEGKNVKISLRGPNYNILEEKTLKLDDMGSASYTYRLPKDAMLGNYNIQAKIDNNYAYANVSVEAFKTPTFEVNLLDNKETVKFGNPFEVKGNAIYYYGLYTADAKVSYTVTKENFFPIFWRAAKPFSPTEIIKEGATTTGKNGEFKITFTPQKDDAVALNQSIPVKYTVSVYVTDKAGNTIHSEKSYIASAKEKFFDIELNKNFLRSATQNPLTVKMTNINGEPLKGTATARLFEAQAPEKWDKYSTDLKKQIKKGEIIKIDKVEFKDGNPIQYMVPPLKEGFYIIEFTPQGSEDSVSENDTLPFLVVNIDKPGISLPENTILPENDTYYPGETAYILLASPKAQSNKYVEVYKDSFLLSSKTLTQKGTALLKLPISKDYQGGFTIRWFSVYDYNIYSGSAMIKVPYINSKLSLELSGTEFSLPGGNKTISLTVLDENKSKVNARALVTVYNKALDYYRQHSFSTLAPYAKGSKNAYNGFESSLDFSMPGPMPILYNSAMPKMAMTAMRSAGALKSAEEAAFSADTVAEAEQAQGGSDSVSFRTDFATNALWLPDLNVKNGFSEFTFKLPQSAGEWKVLAAAFTKDVKTGKTDFNFITRKDLMINLEAPRFLRNGDEIQLQAIVSNTTNEAMPAEVNLTVNHSCEQELDSCQTLEYDTKHILIGAKGQNLVTWSFKAPQEGSEVMFSASAKNAALSDGEIKTVPLLPSEQQLSSSRTVVLKKGTNKLFLGGVDKDAKIQAAHITISPSLLMPVLNAMPLLTKTSRTSATAAANAYFTLSIFNKLYNDYPQLKEAAAKLPQRSSVSPAWSANEELLLNDVAQSPWYLLSKGYNQQQAVIDLFDAKLVEKQKQQAEQDLAKFQNPDGGYPWVKGAMSNMFITLSVLNDFAQAYAHGVKIDETTAKKALNYLVKNYSDKDINIGVYTAYILTAFPKEWNAKSYALASKAMTEFEKNPLQTPLSYAYAASIYKRLGDMDKAKLQIERLFDTSNASDVTGISWTMEERTWQWFEDGITLHAAAIQALKEVAPEDARVDGLVKWLIFNEKAQAWGSPQSAAKAVYALMGIMLKGNVLDQTKIFTTEWNGKTKKITVEPYDLDSSSLTISVYGDEVTPDVFKAAINKAVLTMEKPVEDYDDYATISALFTTSAPTQASQGGLITVQKDYYLIRDGKASKLKEGDELQQGDEVEVRLTVKSESAFDFVVLSDPKPAAFETDTLLSGWKYDGQLSRYEELKDNVTNFFLQNLPKGTYELKYTMRPTDAGTFTSGAAQLQSMYMPEITAHSAGFKVKVK